MLKEFFQRLKQRGQNLNPFDPSPFQDTLAEQIEWTPLKRGGTNFQTHKLVKISRYRMAFQASRIARLFYIIFLLVGLGVLTGFYFYRFSRGAYLLKLENIFLLLFGGIFVAAGCLLLYFGTSPIVFDKRRGFFWKGRKTPQHGSRRNSLKTFTRFSEIYALQLISEYCSGDKGSYYSYELNLVLKNGERINVVDHGNLNQIREDAGILSNYLNRPLWDAI